MEQLSDPSNRGRFNIYQESISVVPLYFAKDRPVVMRNGMILLVDDDRFRLLSGEQIQAKTVRFRTLGC